MAARHIYVLYKKIAREALNQGELSRERIRTFIYNL